MFPVTKTSKNPFPHNIGRGKTDQKAKTVNMKKEGKGKRGLAGRRQRTRNPRHTGGL
jgi:hypothetical protein